MIIGKHLHFRIKRSWILSFIIFIEFSISLCLKYFRGSFSSYGGGNKCCSNDNLFPILAALAAAVFYLQMLITMMMRRRRRRRNIRDKQADEMMKFITKAMNNESF